MPRQLACVKFTRGYPFRKMFEYLESFNAFGTLYFCNTGIKYSRRSDDSVGPFYNEFFFKAQYTEYEFNYDGAHYDPDNDVYYHYINVNIKRMQDSVRINKGSGAEISLVDDGGIPRITVRSNRITDIPHIGEIMEEVNVFNFTLKDHEPFVTVPTAGLSSLVGSSAKNRDCAIFFIYRNAIEIRTMAKEELCNDRQTFGNNDTIRNEDPIDRFVIKFDHFKALKHVKNISENGVFAFYYEPGKSLRITGIINCIGTVTILISHNDEFNVDPVLPEHLRDNVDRDEEDKPDQESTDELARKLNKTCMVGKRS